MDLDPAVITAVVAGIIAIMSFVKGIYTEQSLQRVRRANGDQVDRAKIELREEIHALRQEVRDLRTEKEWAKKGWDDCEKESERWKQRYLEMIDGR